MLLIDVIYLHNLKALFWSIHMVVEGKFHDSRLKHFFFTPLENSTTTQLRDSSILNHPLFYTLGDLCNITTRRLSQAF
jgi:hypothetical protein